MWTWRLWAQAGERPEWLEGTLEVPFWAVATGVGVALLVGLLYFAMRAGVDRDAERAERERD